MSLLIVLVVNMIVLLGLSSLNTLWGKPTNSENKYVQIIYGVIFGLTSILLMVLAWGTETGVFYDARVVLIASVAVLFNPLTTLITVVIGTVYRLSAGGSGAIAGAVLIMWTGMFGVFYRKYIKPKITKNKIMHYLLYGVVAHLFFLFWHILIQEDWEFILNRIRILAPIALTVYPVAVTLLILLLEANDKKLSTVKQLKESEEKYKLLFGSLPVGVLHFDNNGVIVDSNQTFVDIMNTKFSDMIGLDMKKIPNINLQTELRKTLKEDVGRYKGEYQSYLSGKKMFLDAYFYPQYENDVQIGGVGIIQDITKLIEMDEKIREVTNKDSITGFYNRKAYEEDIASNIFDDMYPLVFSYVSIDNMQFFIDTIPYPEFEKLAQNIAAELINQTPEGSRIYRISQNDFVLISKGIDHNQINEFLELISDSLSKHMFLSVKVVTTHFSLVIESKDVSWNDIHSRASTMVQSKRVYSKSFVTKNSIDILLATLFEKSPRERYHSERVASISVSVAKEMGLTQDEIAKLKMAAVLHDIGKINIDSSILDKPSALTKNEYEIIKSHTVSGYRILSTVPEYDEISKIVLSHHERWDGRGYQSGLQKEEIPLLSRIITIADAFDAMRNDRPYRKALSQEEAINEIINCKGTQFDPGVVDAFIKVFKNKDIS